MIDWNSLLGLEWKDGGRERPAVDCYGLVVLFYREAYAVKLRDFVYSDALNSQAVGSIITEARSDWVNTEVPEEGDVVLMREDCPWPTHVAVARTRTILYSMAITGMQVLDLNQPTIARWARPRVEGYYRHRSMA